MIPFVAVDLHEAQINRIYNTPTQNMYGWDKYNESSLKGQTLMQTEALVNSKCVVNIVRVFEEN